MVRNAMDLPKDDFIHDFMKNDLPLDSASLRQSLLFVEPIVEKNMTDGTVC